MSSIHPSFRTDLDFLLCPNEKLTKLLECNLGEVIKMKEKILDATNCKGVRADKLCDLRLTAMSNLETGIIVVDGLLQGGLRCGSLTEIYGLPSSGKSQIAIHLTANTVLKNETNSVLYLTTTYPNVDKLVKVISSLTNSADKQQEQLIDASDSCSLMPCLERVEFYHLQDVHSLMEILWKCDTKENYYKLIVIDSLAALFAPLIGDSHNDAISFLNKVASALKHVAILHNCAVLIINHASSWTSIKKSTNKKPMTSRNLKDDTAPATLKAEFTPSAFLGRYWLTVPNLRFYIRRLNDDNEFELSVARNTYGDDGAKCAFRL